MYKWMMLLVALSAISCKSYLDVNTNEVVPQDPKAELLLPPIMFQMANGTSQDYRFIFKVTQNMLGNYTGSTFTTYYQPWEKHGYPVGQNSDLGGVIWRMTYVDLGLNLENLIKDALKNENYAYAGIGYAIKAWAFQMTTDLHGPIILDEAFKDQLTFHYQDQPDVYKKVRVWGDSAIINLNKVGPRDSYYATKLASTQGDNIFNGNRDSWRRFVYGLYALQYSHLVNKPTFKSQYADSVIKYTDLSMQSAAQDATIFFSASSNSNSNPYGPNMAYLYSVYYGYAGDAVVKLLTGGMRGTPVENATQKMSVDPRLSRMIMMKTDSTYVGQNVLTRNTSVPLVEGLQGKYIFADAARYPIMTSSQLQFTKAEAQFIKGDKEGAYGSYLKGIDLHFDFYNTYGRAGEQPDATLSADDLTKYKKSSEVAHNAGELTMADIMGQKYVAQWGWAGLEQWCDLRKYHYDPNIFRTYQQMTSAQLASQNKGKYAYRFRPRFNSEYVWNSEELAKWGGLDDDYMTHELWFSLPDE
ncbi:Susd and RagB outer membrane lipoprotein [bacterium A37T11]|nr:Susd and RagB outer membrane lipoprotein [bacterium A37T11]